MITLTDQEMRIAALTGSERRIQSFHRPDSHGYAGEDGWTIDIEGAAGELAFAKHLNRYWAATVGTFKAADIGTKIQVRTVSSADLSLIVRPDDDPEQVYVLMVGTAPTFEFGGWIRGRDARQDAYRRAPNGRPEAWFVPRTALHQQVRAA